MYRQCNFVDPTRTVQTEEDHEVAEKQLICSSAASQHARSYRIPTPPPSVGPVPATSIASAALTEDQASYRNHWPYFDLTTNDCLPSPVDYLHQPILSSENDNSTAGLLAAGEGRMAQLDEALRREALHLKEVPSKTQLNIELEQTSSTQNGVPSLLLEAITANISGGGQPVVVVTLEIDAHRTERVPIRVGDSCAALALEVVRRYNLDRNKVWRPLSHFFESQRSRVLLSRQTKSTNGDIPLPKHAENRPGKPPSEPGIRPMGPSPVPAQPHQIVPTNGDMPTVGQRLFALAASRENKLKILRDAEATKRESQEMEGVNFQPRITARGHSAKSVVKRTKEDETADEKAKLKEQLSSEERELKEHCTFKPRVTIRQPVVTGTSEKGSEREKKANAAENPNGRTQAKFTKIHPKANAIAERLSKCVRNRDEKLEEKRRLLVETDTRNGKPLFRPQLEELHANSARKSKTKGSA